MSHLHKEWFRRSVDASQRGIDNIHGFGIRCLRIEQEKFYAQNFHKVDAYHSSYKPNPFRYQYDLCMFIWLNYYTILKEEIKLLRFLHSQDKEKGFSDTAYELEMTQQLYGISRADFLFAAAELRWPTTVLSDGSHHGLFIRDPWSEKRAVALSHPIFKNVISFGGGGQGKTHVSLAFNLMIFDHFILTQKGARCMISTVNEDKLNSVSWSYLCNLNSSTQKGVSLYAGKAKNAGKHTLMRPGNKDLGGVFKGLLIGNQMNSQNIVDKLTGSHGHHFISYIIDEAQSTHDPPIMAAPNYTMHAKDYRLALAGNWGENNDTLAQNATPDIGWDKVDETTGSWISTMQNGSKAIVLHFNNDLSPGMTEEGNRSFPHLPSQKILDRNYPDKTKRNLNNISYRRFWIGYRVEDTDDKCTISDRLVKENMAHLPLDLISVSHRFFAFDSAQAERDRNLMTLFDEGVDKTTKQRVFGITEVHPLEKSTESLKYYQESSDQIIEKARKNNIISGAGIVDWTGRPAHAEMMAAKGFEVKKVIYNKGVPDGVRADPHTGRKEKAIRLNIQLDFKQDIEPDKVCAHHVAENMISLAAWALREYIKAGRVRGINENILRYIGGNRTIDLELYHRKFKLKNSTKYGSRFHLESKDDFKKEYGFSPDILDTLFQGALYMLLYRNLPLTPVSRDDTVYETQLVLPSKEIEDHNEIWEEDLII